MSNKLRTLKWILKRKLFNAERNIGIFVLEKAICSEPYDRWIKIVEDIHKKLNEIDTGKIENIKYDLKECGGINNFDELGNIICTLEKT
jgi:hypothetical protein